MNNEPAYRQADGNPVFSIGSSCPIKNFGHDENKKQQFIYRH